MRAVISACVLLVVILLPAQLHAGIDLAYQPMRVDLRLAAGQTQTGIVQLKNQGGEAVHLRAKMLDFFVSKDNTPQFVAQTDEAYSCRTWAVLNPVEVDIAPEAVIPFRYTLRVPVEPAAVSRTYRCALVFESMPTLEDRLQKKSSNQVRLVTVVYATLGDPAATPEIGNPQIKKTEKEWQLQVPFANSGETHYRLMGQVLIKDRNEQTVETIDMDSSPIHPGTSVDVGFPIKPLADGEYTMDLQLRFGGKILQKEAVVEVLAAQ